MLGFAREWGDDVATFASIYGTHRTRVGVTAAPRRAPARLQRLIGAITAAVGSISVPTELHRFQLTRRYSSSRSP
jgi:hypothetical protein